MVIYRAFIVQYVFVSMYGNNLTYEHIMRAERQDLFEDTFDINWTFSYEWRGDF